MNEKEQPKGPDDRGPDSALSTVEEPAIVLESITPVPVPVEQEAAVKPEPPPAKLRRVPRRVLVAAAATVLLAGAAVALVLLTRESSEPAPTAQRPVPLVAPVALRGAAEDFRVVLSWIQPGDDERVRGYDIYRDGLFLAKVEASERTFVDKDALPATRYEYEVNSFAGPNNSTPATVTVRTRVAPLALARLEGTFNVNTRTVSDSGYNNFADRANFGWEFSPRCDEGPCRVLWRALNFNKVRATFARHGARYTGTFHGQYNVECNGADSTSDLKFRLRVTKARSVFGEWRAVRLVGTYEQTEPAQLGCITGRATISFTGRLVD